MGWTGSRCCRRASGSEIFSLSLRGDDVSHRDHGTICPHDDDARPQSNDIPHSAARSGRHRAQPRRTRHGRPTQAASDAAMRPRFEHARRPPRRPRRPSRRPTPPRRPCPSNPRRSRRWQRAMREASRRHASATRVAPRVAAVARRRRPELPRSPRAAACAAACQRARRARTLSGTEPHSAEGRSPAAAARAMAAAGCWTRQDLHSWWWFRNWRN